MLAWEDYSRYRIIRHNPSGLRHEAVIRHLESLTAQAPGDISLRELGKSVEGRTVCHVQVGQGPRRVLMWSQMHGDEPTHTAVLLDLLAFLTSPLASSAATDILTHCTLHLIPMLNPDGAARGTRFNAQGIDINRDAVRLATPEGRILRNVVERLQPEFAFNLHNQNARTAVGAPPVPAAISLLVPPLGADLPDSLQEQEAKQLAGSIGRAVAPYCGAMISRYDADYMPLCFGEWVQSTSARTILVEAGGSPADDWEWLTQLHFFALGSALGALSEGSYGKSDRAVYESLPRSSEYRLFDLVIDGTTTWNGTSTAPFQADLGIHVAPGEVTSAEIVEIGDLRLAGGKRRLEGVGLHCLPGRVVTDGSLTPGTLPHDEWWRHHAQEGATTVVGQIDLLQERQLEAYRAISHSDRFPLNVAYACRIASDFAGPIASQQLRRRFLSAVDLGAIAIMADHLPEEIADFLPCLGIPWIKEVLPAGTRSCGGISHKDVAARANAEARRFHLTGRGTICRGSAADLILLNAGSDAQTASERVPLPPEITIVQGIVAARRGEFVDRSAGRMIRSTRPGFHATGSP